MIKGDLLAIAYGGIVKQILKLSTTNTQINRKLYQIGVQMGLRMADEYNDRQISYLNSSDTVKEYIKGISLNMMGYRLSLQNEKIKFEKRLHSYHLEYAVSNNHLNNFIIIPQEEVVGQEPLQYHSIWLGFLAGALSTFGFTSKIFLDGINNSLQINESNISRNRCALLIIQMTKVIKEDD